MAYGRVNTSNPNIKELSIFKINDSIDTTYERFFNVFSQVGTDSTRHQIYSGTGKGDHFYMSYGREGNIIFLEPIKEGEVWWVVEYDFDKGSFTKQQEVNLGPGTFGPSVSIENDFNKVKIKGRNTNQESKIVVLGDVKNSTPKYGAWISDDMSVLIKDSGYNDNITYYENGNEEMFSISKNYYFFNGFIFVNNKVAVVATDKGELQAVKIYDVNNFIKQKKKDSSSLVGGFGGNGYDGQGYQFIYNATNDKFLDINTKTGGVVEKKFIYKSAEW